MNTSLKAILALSAGCSLLVPVGAAQAQATADPTLKLAFSTLNPGRTPNVTTASQGVGFDPLGAGGKLSFSLSQATAQSIYEAFTFDSSAAGAFSTLAANSTAQLSVYAVNNNVNGGSGVAPFDVYASLYAYNPSATAGTVPVFGPNLFGAEQKAVLASGQTGFAFTNDFKLTGPITAGSKYVIGFTTLANDTQDFGLIGSSSVGTSGLATSDLAFDTPKFATDANDQGNPAGVPFSTVNSSGFNALTFTLSATPPPAPPAVPEASSVISLAVLLGLGAGAVAFKRRRSLAN